MFENVNPKDLEQGRQYLMSGSVGGKLPLIIESGQGAVVTDAQGKSILIVPPKPGLITLVLIIPRLFKQRWSRCKKSPMFERALKLYQSFYYLKNWATLPPQTSNKLVSVYMVQLRMKGL